MRTLLALALSMAAVACSGNPRVTLLPHDPPWPLLGLQSLAELEIIVIDTAGRAIEGAEVILQAEPAPRRVTTLSTGIARFTGVFIVEPRFFIACAPGFSCSTWIDRRLTESASMQQIVVLLRTAETPRARRVIKQVHLGRR